MRVARRLLHVLLIVLTLMVGATAAAIIVSQTAWFRDWLRGYIVRSASQYLNGTLSIERLGGNLFFGVQMENIGVAMNGERVVAVKNLGLDYNVFQLLTRGLSVEQVRLDHPVIYLRRDGDSWSLSQLIKKDETEADRQGPDKPIAIENIGISSGSVIIDGPVGTSGVVVPKRFEHLDAKLSFRYEPVRYAIEITHVSFRGSEPALALNALSGGIAVKDDTVFVDKLALRTSETSLSVDGAIERYLSKPVFNLQISSDKLSLPEIARIVPALAGVRLQPKFQVKLAGPLDRLGIEMNVQSSAGDAWARLTADVESPGQSVAGTLSVRHLDLAPILNAPKQKSDLTADATVDLRAADLSDPKRLRGTASVTAQRVTAAGYTAGPVDAKARIDDGRVDLSAHANAYGASASASGRITIPELAFDLRGTARRLDLRKLPRDLNVPPATTEVNVAYHVQGSTANLAGEARFEPSTVAGASIAEGSTASFTRRGKDVGYGADATITGVDLERIGREFDVPALADRRYQSGINAHITAKGSGTRMEDLDVTANGTLTDSTVLGGTIPQLTFDAAVAHDTAHLKATGAFAGFDPAALSGRPELKGTIAGNMDVDATLTNVSAGVTPDTVEGTVRAALGPSAVGGLQIASAKLDGDYRNSSGEIRTLDIVGRDLNVSAKGTIALNETGQSKLDIHADSPSLDSIGTLIEQPLSGIAKVDATITGNRRKLTAKGTATGNGFKYQDDGALTVSTDFTATVEDLDAASATVSAATNATFVTIAGQNINELTAKTEYANKRVDFEATAKQPQRSLAANGAVLLHPDHQELHVERLGLQSQTVHWQTPPQSEATVRYGAKAIAVDGFRLVNGDQQIAADGTFGKPGDALNVTLTNIDVATVDALLLREPQLSGRLNASATVTGTTEAPVVDATFAIDHGGVRQFKYDTFGGTVTYAANGIDLDTRLQQNPTTWLTAKGHAPLSATAARNRYDIHVDSSPIDLGLVQGFTTELTNVTGTLQATVDVTGVAGDPRPNGQVTIQNGAALVASTGVGYTNLEGRIDLQPDKVHISEIRVLDNHRQPLTISGDLAIAERELGGVSIAITSDDFKVIDNKMGNLRVNSNLRIAGELSAPRIEGDLGISTGQLNLDPILARFGQSAYATEATRFASADVEAQASAGSPFDALYAYVHLTVPNDLVIKASDLKAPDAAFGLGALNLTLGGDVIVHKAPWDQPRVYGVVNTVRGNYDFQGRRFEILRDGSVRFEGTDDFDPALDIRTQRVIQAVTANVTVRGRLNAPTIALSSVPPLEEADILSLIVFNQQLNQLGEGAQVSLAQRAQGMALGAVAGQLTQSIGDALNLDTFELNLAPDSGGPAQLTVGQQVGQNLFLKVQQGLGDQSQTTFILEYELTKWLRFRTSVLQGAGTQTQRFQRAQGSGVDLLFFFGF